MSARWRLMEAVIIFLLTSGCCFSSAMVADLKNLPQDHIFYLEKASADREWISPEEQKSLDEKFNQAFFAPWHQEQGPVDSEASSWFKKYNGNPGYGENKKKHNRGWLEKFVANANLAAFPNTNRKAITVTNTVIRELPTLKPHFNSFEQAGEGYPFDNLQYSAVAANTPIFVSHITKDQQWLWAESHYGMGWMPAADVAFVDPSFIEIWEKHPQVAVTHDESPLHPEGEFYPGNASLGWIFPKAGETEESYRILMAVGDENKNAVIKTATLAKNQATGKPMPLKPANLARLANELINQPYGWGGMYGNRDCSAMIKDLFAPFGVWLPRNSGEQAIHGTFVSLKERKPSAREKEILEKGLPYLTLIGMRGHIMLYIGTLDGKAIVFHNTWGIRTRDFWGREGRKIIGRAVITTLHLGEELWDIDPERGVLLNRVEGMTFLIPPRKNSP